MSGEFCNSVLVCRVDEPGCELLSRIYCTTALGHCKSSVRMVSLQQGEEG